MDKQYRVRLTESDIELLLECLAVRVGDWEQKVKAVYRRWGPTVSGEGREEWQREWDQLIGLEAYKNLMIRLEQRKPGGSLGIHRKIRRQQRDSLKRP
jgi:hypothetical protein